jgi:hypothetical protein
VLTCHDEDISMSDHNRAHSEAPMTTRKQKPTFPTLIELPAEQLQLVTVTVDAKTPARGRQTRQVRELPATRALPRRGKVTLH